MEGSWGSFVSRKNESVLIVEPGEGGGGGGCGVGSHLSLFKCRTEIGVIVSNDSKCRTRETGVTVSRNNDSRINKGDRCHLSLGIVILTVEPGGLGSFVSRNNDYIYRRTWERVEDHLFLRNTDSTMKNLGQT